ncbi:MAG: hypothetical protein AAF340_09415 [Pseudomonadota bacterium]
MRAILASLAVAGLAACAPPIPDSGPDAGVGFGDYNNYIDQQQAREQELSGINAPASEGASDAQQLAAAAVTAIGQDGQTGAPQSNPGISDEQDFNAVSQRQTIASDAARRRQQQGQYQVVTPEAVPSRPGSTVPTPIEFALLVSHPVGQKTYSRSPFGRAKVAANCARYGSGELAQDAFLKAGGPDKDKLKLDPDGDGYACGWNPAKYRALVQR